MAYNDIIHSDSRGESIRLIGYATVTEVQPNGMLKVKLTGSEEITCAPLLPKHLSVIPKINQGVFVLSATHKKSIAKDQIINGYWVGPLISQFDKLEDEDAESAKSLIPEGPTRPGGNIEDIPKAKGLYPNNDDISLQGRGSGDLILKDKQSVLRIAKFKNDNRLVFNDNNIGYLQLKDNEDNTSTINVVANKINLISHNGAHTYNLSDREELINSDSQKQIEEQSQSIVYGEKLVQFLSLIKEYVLSHTHPYHGLPSDPAQTKLDVLSFDLESILNKNIKTN